MSVAGSSTKSIASTWNGKRAMTSRRGPRWTRKRLEMMLRTCYGETERGGVDVAVVAMACGVSTRTVRRWLSGTNRQLAAIPSPRLAQLRLPAPDSELRSQQQADYARDAITSIALPKGRGILPAWRDRGWLDTHVVAIVDLAGKPWRQVVISNGSARSMKEFRRRGSIVDLTTLPTRFHGVVLAHEVLQEVEPWRVHPRSEILPQGRTQVWSDDAPAVDLAVLAVARELK
jgi:hypothetical protein